MGILDLLFGKKSSNDSSQNQKATDVNNKQTSASQKTANASPKPSAKRNEELSATPFVFESDQYQKYENGNPVQRLQNCPRTIKLEKNVNGCSGYELERGDGYIVRIIDGDTGLEQMAA